MSRGSRNKRAFTLIEVAVYSSILLLLLGGVFMVVEGGMRYFRLASAHETVNQQAVIALSRVRAELANASQSSVVIDTSPQNYILFLSPFGLESSTDPADQIYEYQDNQLIWKKWVCFYRDSSERLVRAELDTPDENNPSTPPIPDFAGEILPLPTRTVAHNVEAVSFQFFPAPAVVRITVETQQDTASDRTTNLELVSSARLVNI